MRDGSGNPFVRNEQKMETESALKRPGHLRFMSFKIYAFGFWKMNSSCRRVVPSVRVG